MERLQGEIDLAPLRPVLILRPLLPRSRVHLRQIKREFIDEPYVESRARERAPRVYAER